MRETARIFSEFFPSAKNPSSSWHWWHYYLWDWWTLPRPELPPLPFCPAFSSTVSAFCLLAPLLEDFYVRQGGHLRASYAPLTTFIKTGPIWYLIKNFGEVLNIFSSSTTKAHIASLHLIFSARISYFSQCFFSMTDLRSCKQKSSILWGSQLFKFEPGVEAQTKMSVLFRKLSELNWAPRN